MADQSGPRTSLPSPLEGITIVEYGVFHAGPGGTAILGDLGADIIKVESGTGDPERYWKTIAGLDLGLPNGESIWYEASNRNKKGIHLDIKTDAGRAVFHRLIEKADVFLTNLRKSTKQKLGIDYESLRSFNPKLIHANVSGYGPEGQWSDLGAFDPLGQAVSGMTFTTGAPEPLLLHMGLLDQATAIAASHAILTALLARERQGMGQEVHVSLYSTAIWLQYGNFFIDSLLNVDPSPPPNRNVHSPLRNRFVCKDGRWVIGTHHPEEKYWRKFCRLISRMDLYEDPRYTDKNGCPIPGKELLDQVDPEFAKRTRDEWMGIFQPEGLMFCPVRHISEIKDDPQAIENDYVTRFEHPALGEITVPGYPVRFSSSRAGIRRAAPGIGEHTREVLAQFGYTEDEIALLKAEGVVK